MKNKYIIPLAALAMGLLSVSCNDFLDRKPESQASTGNFYRNDADIENVINSCYGNMQKSSLYSNFMITMAEVRSDNVEDQNPGGNAGRDYNIDKFTAGADNAAITGVWQHSYHTIMRCNAALDNINVCTDASRKAQYEGEARFIRALMYFNLVRFYGAVPIVDRQLTIEESVNSVRDDVDKVYQFIEDDLTIASSCLPKSYSKTQTGRATSGAALTLLAKVYLTQGLWSDCKSTLERVLSSEYSGVYELLPDVTDVFKQENKLNNEMIFVIHYSKSVIGEGHGFNDAFKNGSLLDINLKNAYSSNDMRRGLLDTRALDKDNTPVIKFYDTFDPTTKNVGYDYPILRYADVLLMYAEALNEISYSVAGDAKKYLNMVRTRSGADAYTDAELSSQAAFRDAVLQERRLEFPLEMHRWFDLIRTNTAEAAMKKIGITITKNDYLYPIPKTEIDLCPNFTQNPGYTDK